MKITMNSDKRMNIQKKAKAGFVEVFSSQSMNAMAVDVSSMYSL